MNDHDVRATQPKSSIFFLILINKILFTIFLNDVDNDNDDDDDGLGVDGDDGIKTFHHHHRRY